MEPCTYLAALGSSPDWQPCNPVDDDAVDHVVSALPVQPRRYWSRASHTTCLQLIKSFELSATDLLVD